MFPESKLNTLPTTEEVAAAQEEEVDLSSVNWDEVEVVAENTTGDINEILAPPAAGYYPFRVSFQNRGEKASLERGFSPKVGGFLKGWFKCEMISDKPEDNGYIANYFGMSIVQQRKKTSPIHHLMNLAGTPVPERIKLPDLEALVAETFSSNPIIWAWFDWKADVSDPNNLTKKANNGWARIASHMTQFPKDSDSETGFANIIESPIDGTAIPATGYIEKFVTQQEAQASK